MAGKNIAAAVDEIVRPAIEKMGYAIWDIEYVREGTEWFLRITIDSEKGISIDDCEAVARVVDPLLDLHDPIDNSYRLEVSSPGIERVLRTDAHIAASIDCEIEVRLFAPQDGKRSYRGSLVSYADGVLTVETKSGERKFAREQCSKINIAFDF